jgi:Ran GTPase-activating protein (RanGAP) involved in mRNA processing and transport
LNAQHAHRRDRIILCACVRAADCATTRRQTMPCTVALVTSSSSGPTHPSVYSSHFTATDTLSQRSPRCPLGDANALADALAMNDTITSIDLGSCSLGAVDAAALGRGLQTNRSLTHLGLSGNRITGGVIDDMATDGALQAIAELITHNSTLKELDLQHNSITSIGVAAIACALRTNPALTSLDLGNNPIDDGVVALADALHSNSHLAWLHVEHAQSMTLVGLTALANMLHSNTGLRVLHLGGNRIKNDGARVMLKGLKSNRHLQHLELGGCMDGDQDGNISRECKDIIQTILRRNGQSNVQKGSVCVLQ